MTATQDPDSPPASDEDLNDAERRLLEAAATGTPVDLQTGDPDMDNPANAGDWGDDRDVRGGFLADLLTGDRPTGTGRLRSVKLRGARITGKLDLESRRLLCPLLALDCCFAGPVDFGEAEAVSMSFVKCHFRAFSAVRLRTSGSVGLSGCIAHGTTNFYGARIGGGLDLAGATLAGSNGTALDATNITVERDIFCRQGFTAEGEVKLYGARVGGGLNFIGASLASKNGTALDATNITVQGDVFGRQGFTAEGEIKLLGAHIAGGLDLAGATLANKNGRALDADSITIGETMFCNGGFTAEGEIDLIGARIGGGLDLAGATLVGSNGTALDADTAAISQTMFCNEGFTAEGEIRLYGARIGGDLDFTQAALANSGGSALDATNIIVEGDIFCRQGFTAEGEICLVGARISGGLDLAGATLANKNGTALDIDTAAVSQAMFCSEGFTAQGAVNLVNARVGVFYDDQDSWPDALHLNGFVYDRLGNQDVSVRARLEWLRRHPGRFTPGIYDQLADVYRRAGDEGAARKVAVAKQWRRRRPYNPLSWLWWVTVGYGYRTWQAFIWAAALALAGSLVFAGAYPGHMVALSAHPPRFQPVIYTLDVLLPIGGLGQKSAWQATGGFLDWYWALAIAGWVLSAAVVAGLTGILKRD